MNKLVSYNTLLRDISILSIKLSEYTSKIQLAKMNMDNAPRWVRWFYKLDVDDYIQVQSKLMYRYKTLMSIRENFYKFVSGISKKEYKDTRKLVELLDKLKMVEALDMLHVQVEDINIAIKDFKVQLDSKCKRS